MNSLRIGTHFVRNHYGHQHSLRQRKHKAAVIALRCFSDMQGLTPSTSKLELKDKSLQDGLKSISFANEKKTRIVKLAPPKISPETLSQKIVCTRPMREGKFNISAQKYLDKTIINCYGHGGSGWTTLFGSVNKAIQMEYMIYTKVQQDGKDEYIYLFPKDLSVTPGNVHGSHCAAVLGGTFIPDVDKLPFMEQQKVDHVEYKKLLDRNSQFYHGHPYF